MTLTVRKSRPEDLDELYLTVKLAANDFGGHPSYFAWLESMRNGYIPERLANDYSAVLDHDGKAVGSMFLDWKTGELHGGYIRPAYQRQGWGSKLLAYLFEQYDPPFSYGEPEASNLASQALLRRFGYRITSAPYKGIELSEGVWIRMERGETAYHRPLSP